MILSSMILPIIQPTAPSRLPLFSIILPTNHSAYLILFVYGSSALGFLWRKQSGVEPPHSKAFSTQKSLLTTGHQQPITVPYESL
jgi:hypothetical protein